MKGAARAAEKREQSLSPATRLILRRALPRLVKSAADVRGALARYDPSIPATLAGLTWIPGSEALAALAALDNDAREAAIERALMGEEDRRGLRDTLVKLGDPEDPSTAAAALIRAFPDAAQVPDAVQLREQRPVSTYNDPLPLKSPRPETECRLVLETSPGGIEALWQRSDGSSFRFPLVHGITDEDRDEHRWYLEDYLVFPGPGDHIRARAVERRLESMGQKLYRALLHDGVDVLGDLIDAPEPRVLTIHTGDPEALSLPWELLHDGRAYLALRGVMVRRELPAARAPSASGIRSLPLRVLLIIARPDGAGFFDPRFSAAPMLDALDVLGDQVRVDLCEPPTLAELQRRLASAAARGERYDIVHFDGHGTYLPSLGVSALAFEKEDGTADLVRAPELADLLRRSDVRVVLLEACGADDPTRAPVFFGVVSPGLVASGIGSLVVFSHGVAAKTGRVLVEQFYQAITRGANIGAALQNARIALHGDPERPTGGRDRVALQDWHVPQLYQAGPDFALLSVDVLARAAGTMPLQRGTVPSKEFELVPMYGFFGRARELLALQRRLGVGGAVALTGGGGMGKTSLVREAARWWDRIGLRPDGAAFFSFESRQGADRAVQAFVQYVEGDKFQPGSPEDLWGRAVRYFRDQEILWVWDNFESTLAQYQKGHDEGSTVFADEERDRLRRLYVELTEKGSRGWLVVTCQPESTELSAIAEMALGGLARTDALDMARTILARYDVTIGDAGYDRETIEDLLKAMEHHPLSIELVMAHCKVLKPADAAKDLRKVMAAAVQAAGEDRNRSLLASLKWSTGRLSEETQRVLPYLAWFDGGAFEDVLEDFCNVGPEVWGRVKEELVATALVRVENDVLFGNKPYLGFHPTLPYAVDPGDVENRSETEQRFVRVYHGVAASVSKALQGAAPAGAMQVMLREGGNLRRALVLAFEHADYEGGGRLADTIGLYLSSTGRVRDQMRLAAWVQERMVEASGPAKWDAERNHAWGLFLAGRGQQAVDLLMRQIGEIDRAGVDRAGGRVRHTALCYGQIARILISAGQPQHALGPLAKAIEGFEAAGDRGNLSAALGDQANALRALGKLAEALASAERAIAIDRERGDARSEAAGLTQLANILSEQHRYDEAERRYDEALSGARQAGDWGLQGEILQYLGTLARRQGQYALAVTRYKDALARFQSAEDRTGEMVLADLLGTAETNLGHYEPARAWHSAAERLARDLGDEKQLGVTAQNVGILLEKQAFALRDDAGGERQRLLGEAAASVATSLAAWRKLGNEVYAAASLSQLGVIHRHLGNFDDAESHSEQALAIRERLDLPDVYKDYWNLEDIAVARNHPEEAAAWRAKKEAKIAELDRLAGANTPPRLSPEARQAFLSLTQTLHATLTAHQPIPLDLATTLTQLAAQPDPLGAAGRFLQSIAEGHLPNPPPGLPPDLEDIFAELLKSLRASPS